MRWALSALLLGACFSPSFDECKIVCGSAGCPAGMECGTSGYCQMAGEPVTCGPLPDGLPDSSIPIVDAEPVSDGLSLDGPCEVELLVNGGFEATEINGVSSPPWVANGAPLPRYLMTGQSGFTAHGGIWGVRFGEANDIEQDLGQDLGTMPPGTRSLRVSFHYRTVSAEPLLNRDLLEFELWEGANELGTFTYIDGAVDKVVWTEEEAFRDGDFGGRQLSLHLHLTTDPLDISAFEIDDVSLRAVVCD